MPAAAVRHQHRHFKTLIALVVATTGGTFFLYGAAKLSPVTPLRANVSADKLWTDIDVSEQLPGSATGFYHWRIDKSGRPASPSDAWNNNQDPYGNGRIQLLVASPSKDGGITKRQAEQLDRLITELRGKYNIPKDRVHTR